MVIPVHRTWLPSPNPIRNAMDLNPALLSNPGTPDTPTETTLSHLAFHTAGPNRMNLLPVGTSEVSLDSYLPPLSSLRSPSWCPALSLPLCSTLHTSRMSSITLSPSTLSSSRHHLHTLSRDHSFQMHCFPYLLHLGKHPASSGGPRHLLSSPSNAC